MRNWPRKLNRFHFVRARVADRQYRITVLAEMLEELRAVSARVTEGGRLAAPVYREARERLKQIAIETGQWSEDDRITEDCGPDYSHLSVEELREQQAILAEAKAKLDALRQHKPSEGLIEAAPGSLLSGPAINSDGDYEGDQPIT